MGAALSPSPLAKAPASADPDRQPSPSGALPQLRAVALYDYDAASDEVLPRDLFACALRLWSF